MRNGPILKLSKSDSHDLACTINTPIYRFDLAFSSFGLLMIEISIWIGYIETPAFDTPLFQNSMTHIYFEILEFK